MVLYGYGGQSQSAGKYLADSINILSIDPTTQTTTIVPIPRDLWLEGFAELPDNGKVNEAFAIGYVHGGLPHAAEVSNRLLERVTGLRLPYWLTLDFSGFAAMVDAVGGVDIDNPVAFSYALSEPDYEAGVFTAGSFGSGHLHLDGQAALFYARSRYTSVATESSDFARSVRQQRVLSAIRQQLGGGLGSIGPGMALMDAVSDSLKTNLSALDLLQLAGHLTPDRRIELAEGVILEATSNSIGQYILVVKGRASGGDYTPLQAYIQAALAQPLPTPTPSESPPP